jgi:hypothetical protein
MNFFLCLCLILIFTIYSIIRKDLFTSGGKSFSIYYEPKSSSNLKYLKGSYLRSEIYQNMCEPSYGGISKIPIQINDTCIKTL